MPDVTFLADIGLLGWSMTERVPWGSWPPGGRTIFWFSPPENRQMKRTWKRAALWQTAR